MLNRQPASHPRADDLLLMLGKTTRLCWEFENKCKEFLRIAQQANIIKDAPDLSLEEIVKALPPEMQLNRTIKKLPHLGVAGINEIGILENAREARNELIHEGGWFPLRATYSNNYGWFTQSLKVLRTNVRMLAEGENLISSWIHMVVDRDEHTPQAFIDGYVESVEQWVFASVWDLLQHPEGQILNCRSADGRVYENWGLLPEHVRPPGC